VHDVRSKQFQSGRRPAQLGSATDRAKTSWVWLTGRRLLRTPQGKIGVGILGFFLLIALFAPLISPDNPLIQFKGHELQGPSTAHIFGTDEYGRDILSRILYGSQISFMVGLISVVIGSVVGVSTGLIAGYVRGWVEALIMRIWDAVLAFPGILTGVATVTILGPGTLSTALAVGIITMPGFARLALASTIAERNKEYVFAAESVGVPTRQIITRHILPNAIGPLLVHAALSFAAAVFFEAALSFLGLGSQPPTPSWGSMLAESRQYLLTNPTFALFPGIAISILLVGLNSLADGLRDALDPSTIGRL